MNTKSFLEKLLAIVAGASQESAERFGLHIETEMAPFKELLLRSLKEYRDEITAEKHKLVQRNAELTLLLSDTDAMIAQAKGSTAAAVKPGNLDNLIRHKVRIGKAIAEAHTDLTVAIQGADNEAVLEASETIRECALEGKRIDRMIAALEGKTL